jgi:circadian clock protein KaiC
MARCKTGIEGFDALVEGGFPVGQTVLYTGTPGTGKTIFGLEYLYNGVTKFKEKGLYVTFEETKEQIFLQGKQFGWDLEKIEKSGMLKIISKPAREIDKKTSLMIIDICRKEKIKRLVIDSLSTLSINAPIFSVAENLSISEVVNQNTFFSPPVVGDLMVKRFVYNFIDDLRTLDDTTTLLISENSIHADFLSRDTISEFLCDGVIVVTFESLGGAYSRSLLVRKMRATKNDEDIHPLEISKNGLIVHSIDEK